MSDSSHQHSPLVERNTEARRRQSPPDPGVTLRERPYLGYINLRGNVSDSAFAEAVRGVIGVDLPSEPNTFSESDDCRAIWLGPDEWYIVTAPGAEATTVDALEQALADRPHAVNDVTGGTATLELHGPRARDVIGKGCTLDLHPRAFGPGQCAQTLISHAGVVIRHVDDTPTFELVVRRSFADYLWIWLEDSALEYGLAVTD